MKKLDIYGHKNGGIVPTLIRLRTNSNIHHVSIGLGNNFFESTALGNGVGVSNKKKDNIIMTFSISLTDEEYNKCLDFANKSVGKVKYDFLGVIALFFGITTHKKHKNYCNEFALEVLKLAKENNITEAIMKEKSPSCGCGKVYDGSFSKKLIDGDGVTTALLKKNGIKIIPSEEL